MSFAENVSKVFLEFGFHVTRNIKMQCEHLGKFIVFFVATNSWNFCHCTNNPLSLHNRKLSLHILCITAQYFRPWILGSSTGAWHICSTPSCTGSMFRSESSISSEWQFTGVSKARLPSTSWTAATPLRTLPVVSDFDLPAATIFSYHDIVAARSAVGSSPLLVRWPGMRCLTTSETRRSVPTISGRS